MTLRINVKMNAVKHTPWVTLGRRVALFCCALGLFSACRGDKSSKPPIHLNRNMDTQDKYKPQRISTIFEDGRAMRPPVEGAVGRDLLSVRYEVTSSDMLGKKLNYQEDDRYLQDDDAYWRGLDAAGKPIDTIPSQITVNQEFVERGQDRYNIYCTPCHGVAGYGNGSVAMKANGAINVPSYHQDYMRSYASGHIYGVIANGSASGIMMGYKHQIPTQDRWAIVAYVRALQRSQLGYATDNSAQAEADKNKNQGGN